MRGEGDPIFPPESAISGSSPHARGRPGRARTASEPRRLIPVCAGRAQGSRFRCGHRPAHPRMRGEGPMRIRDVMVELGSSPHAWGGRGPGGRGSCVVRLIPACAGRARSARRSRTRRAAHPRMRGEGPARVLSVAWVIGSSPHARGGLVRVDDTRRFERLIPACAGRAGGWGSAGSPRPAHPRMRGEGGKPGEGMPEHKGSSPHARGGLDPPGAGGRGDRLIPACAGRAGPHLERP